MGGNLISGDTLQESRLEYSGCSFAPRIGILGGVELQLGAGNS
jgi:hypothetical protein